LPGKSGGGGRKRSYRFSEGKKEKKREKGGGKGLIPYTNSRERAEKGEEAGRNSKVKTVDE